MKISARNQLTATISAIDTGIVNVRISLMTSKGAKLTSVITHTSAESMNLLKGDDVMAFFKASHVMIATGHIDGISARNQLEGMIEKVTKGAVNTEVTLLLEGGEHIISIITNESAKELGLIPGQKAVAIIKSTDIMIAKN
ncbi:MAG: TOBE domain-containing protein [Campylobacterales bacterium]|nr:TOBE domain-containing protein [Campylobacterales bacterium]